MYWEKTVEYLFLWHCTHSGLIDFASPMAGKQERGAGDAVFGNYSKLLLVEFKSDVSSLDSEQEKFDDFKVAKRLLYRSDSHHLLVYGRVSEKQLCPVATTYFSRNSVQIDRYLPQGLPKEAFDQYLLQFLALRKRDGRSGGKATIPDFANVIGLNMDGKIVQACTLSDYTGEVFPSFVQELAQEAVPSSPVLSKFKP